MCRHHESAGLEQADFWSRGHCTGTPPLARALHCRRCFSQTEVLGCCAAGSPGIKHGIMLVVHSCVEVVPSMRPDTVGRSAHTVSATDKPLRSSHPPTLNHKALPICQP